MKNLRLCSYDKYERNLDVFDLKSVSMYLFDVNSSLHTLPDEDRRLDIEALYEYYLDLLKDYVLIVRWGKQGSVPNYLVEKQRLKELLQDIKSNVKDFPVVPSGEKLVQMIGGAGRLDDYITWRFSYSDFIPYKLVRTKTGWETVNF